MPFYRSHILVCAGTGCVSSGSLTLEEQFNESLSAHGLEREVQVVRTGCFGLCEAGPICIVYPEGSFYTRVESKDVNRIVEEHLLKGRVVKELLFQDKSNHKNDAQQSIKEVDFYKKQDRVALKNCGVINPELIEEYIAFDGYQALGKVLSEMTPVEVIQTIKESGLRGRGGGGFLTGLKWEFAKNTTDDVKYVGCNADEGDPGAFMDRSVLEGDPHAVIEAMAINAYAIGAKKGFVYIRAEYPIAVKRLGIAIAQAKDMGLLGENILGTDFTFDLEIRLGAGAFVCGEETALIASIEGQRGMPRPKPPFPAHKGLFGQPTVINNVETYAVVPQIILKGVDWFRTYGTPNSPGTKVFALGGKIVNTGLVEISMGTTLREVIFDIGGGIPNGNTFKAVQTGGPSGGCLTKDHLDTPIDFDTLTSLGSMMGSGGMIVVDNQNCMVDFARFFLDFTVDESCGKCTPCREGTKRMHEILDRITQGQGTLEDLDKLESLSASIKDSSLCGLGQTAPNPVLSTLKYFKDEYIAHVVDKKCPAGVCKELLSIVIDERCIGCTACTKVCPVNCIAGERKSLHVIDQEKCIKCGACIDKCPVKCIVKG